MDEYARESTAQTMRRATGGPMLPNSTQDDDRRATTSEL
jgi:hypothetical protein